MKFALFSDVHLEFSPYTLPFPEADVLLLAGDICLADSLRPNRTDKHARRHCEVVKDFFTRANETYKKIFYIPGNHEYYRSDLSIASEVIRNFLDLNIPDHHIELMDDGDITLWPNIPDKIALFGATLWTDYNNNNPVSKLASMNGLNDFRLIDKDGMPVTPEDFLEIHKKTVSHLEKVIAAFPDYKMVVMTHHAPSALSVHPQFKDMTHLNGAYYSSLEHLMKDNVKVWVHGHVHNEFDYMVGGTRILANPRGYEGVEVNRLFNPNMVFEV